MLTWAWQSHSIVCSCDQSGSGINHIVKSYVTQTPNAVKAKDVSKEVSKVVAFRIDKTMKWSKLQKDYLQYLL